MKIFTYIFIFCSVISFAQTPTVNWGEEFKFEKRISITEMLSDSTYFYVVKRTSKKDAPVILVERFEQTSVQKKETIEVKIPFINNQLSTFEDILLLGETIWLFSSVVVENNKLLYATPVNFNSTDQLNSSIEIDRFVNGNPKLARQSSFDLVESGNSKNLLVLHNSPFEKYNNEVFSYKVFNSKLELQWAKEIELPYKGQFFKLTNHLIDNSGNVHMISAISPERIKGENTDRGIPNNKYNLLTYYPKENKLKEFEITLGEKYVSSLSCALAPNGDLVIGGFYSNSAMYSIAGTFYLSVDPVSRRVISSNLKAFEKDFLLEFLPEKKIKKGKELSDFYFDHFIVRPDGSAVFIAEQYYMQIIYTYNDPFGYGYGAFGYGSPYYYSRNNYNYQYYYNELIVVSVNPQGEIEWTKKIPKRQLSTNDGGYYSSYALAHNDKNIYVLFNDNPRNTPEYRAKNYELYSMTKPSKSTALFLSIDNSGKIEYQPLFSQKDMNLILRPKMHYQPTANQLIIFSQRGNKYKFGSITLP